MHLSIFSRTGPQVVHGFPPLPTSNRFEHLPHYENPRTPAANLENNRSVYGKKKAISPLDEEIQTKRQRDQNKSEKSDSEHSDMEHVNQDPNILTQNDLQDEATPRNLPDRPMTRSDHHINSCSDGSTQADNQSGANSQNEAASGV